MATPNHRVEWVCEQLGRLLEAPELFGLRKPLPKQLENALRPMHTSLREALMEMKEEAGNEVANKDLASELSQDADACPVEPPR